MNRLQITKVNEQVYLLNDHNESTGYLVIGEKKALLIDTMNGVVNVDEEVLRWTGLPYEVVNTHGHRDHVAGNRFVKEAYIHPEDLSMAQRCLENPSFHWKMMKEGDIFDLGGLVLEVYEVPGHTKGSICLLDRKHRILFSGDGILPTIWMHFAESLTVHEFHQSLVKLDGIRDAYDTLLSGHSLQPMPGSVYDRLLAGVEEIMNSRTQEDSPCQFFGTPGIMHRYDSENPRCMVVYKNI